MRNSFFENSSKQNDGFLGNKGVMRILLIVLSSLVIIFLTPWVIVFCFSLLELCGLGSHHAVLIKDNGELFVAIIATIAILYQLRQSKSAEDKLKDIEEAKFILQYNQAFIENAKICEIEALLEGQKDGTITHSIITDENRQDFINYLVYLEGFSTSTERGILSIKNIDNLFAYRFFLAMNNKELQEDQICSEADYFRGSIKLYDMWSKYRKAKGLPILMEENSLDKWLDFEDYIGHDVVVRKYKNGDSLKDIARVLYQTDRYIYPAAFVNESKAKAVLPELFNIENSVFSKENIFVAIYNGKIVGASIVLSKKRYKKIGKDVIEKYRSELPDFEDVCCEYFNTIVDHSHSTNIMCLSVDKAYRNNRIGTILFKKIVSLHQEDEMTLQVLKQYSEKDVDSFSPAIRLYQNCGFEMVEEVDGYSIVEGGAPRVLEMRRQATKSLKKAKN